MKYPILAISFLLSANLLFSQSKKETIELLQTKIDSLSKEIEITKIKLKNQTDLNSQLNLKCENLNSSLSEKEQVLKELSFPGRITSTSFKKYSHEFRSSKADSTVQKLISIQHIDPFTINVYTKNERDFFLEPDKSWEMCDEIQYVYHFTYDSLLYLVEIWPSCSHPDDFITEIFYDSDLNPVYITFETSDPYVNESGGGRLTQAFTFTFLGQSLLRQTHAFSDNSWFGDGFDPDNKASISNREIISTCSNSNHEKEDYEFDFESDILNKISLCYLSQGCFLSRLRLAYENSTNTNH